MDWSLLGHDIFVSSTGALGLLVGQKIQWYRNTWRCPHCRPQGKTFNFTTPDKGLREEIAKDHIRKAHPSQ